MFAAHHAGAYGSKQRGFPRLVASVIGTPQDYQNYVSTYAKYDFVLLGMYPGWVGGGSFPTVTAVCNGIKALNPNCLLGNYTYMLTPWLPSDAAYVNAQVGPGGVGDWNLYDNTGTVVSGDHANITLLTTPDSNGDRWPQYAAKTRAGLNWTGAGAHRSGPTFDAWFMDNVFFQPQTPSGADYNRSGTNWANNSTNARTWWRAGQAAYFVQANASRPATQVLMPNSNCDMSGGPTAWTGISTPFPDYQGLCGAAVLESLIGQTWSVEYQPALGFTPMMAWYHGTFPNLCAPRMVVFCADWDNATYQDARYAMACCLMDNGWFNLNLGALTGSGNYIPANTPWIDEFDLVGTAGTKWLGAAVDGPQTSAWSSGVYMRRFTGGMVLCNPRGNGSKTVTPPSGYTRFSGTQDSTTNNGTAVTSTVTLADRDGLFLVKTGTNGY